MATYKQYMGILFCHFFNGSDHVRVYRMFQILRSAKHTSCDGINGADDGQWNIKFWIDVGEGENVLLQFKVATMHTTTLKRMMSCQNDQFFCIAAENGVELGQYLIFRLVVAV